MSHFSVLCVGNPEEVMAPFSEQDKAYFRYKETTDEFRRYYKEKGKSEDFLEAYPEGGLGNFAKWCGYEVVEAGETEYELPEHAYALISKDETEIIESFRYSNPDAVYDYYDDGCDSFILKDGTSASVAIKKDIDFEAIKKKYEESDREMYRKVVKCCGFRIPDDTIPWRELYEKVKSGEYSRERAEEIYNGQIAVKSFEKNQEKVFGTGWMGWGFDVADYRGTEDEYIERECSTVMSIGIATENGYESKSEVMMFGMTNDKMSSKEWEKRFWEIIDSLPDDAELHMLDCHI